MMFVELHLLGISSIVPWPLAPQKNQQKINHLKVAVVHLCIGRTSVNSFEILFCLVFTKQLYA